MKMREKKNKIGRKGVKGRKGARETYRFGERKKISFQRMREDMVAALFLSPDLTDLKPM